MKLKLAGKVQKNKLLYISTLTILSGGLFCGGWQKFKAAENAPESNVVVDVPMTRVNDVAMSVTSEKEVIRYGIVLDYWTFGYLRMSYYDIEQKKILDGWQGYQGFWAGVSDIEKDYEEAVALIKYAESNRGSIFRIVGKKDHEGCYFGSGEACLENIRIKQIEVVIK